MDDIRKLEELKNSLKILSNEKKFEFKELENLYSKFQIEIDELEDLIIEINERQYTLLKFEVLSLVGIILSVISTNQNIENSSFFLIAFIIIFVINTIKYIKGIMEYLNKCSILDDMEYEKLKIEINVHDIEENINNIDDEIDNIYEIIKSNDDIKVKDYVENNYLKLINKKQI